MSKVREDAWTEKEDQLVVETVIQHIANGLTQLQAFQELEDKLGRTSNAIGYRFNAFLRQQNREIVQRAKEIRRQRRKSDAIIEVKRDKPLKKQEEVAPAKKIVRENLISKPASSNIYEPIAEILNKYGHLEKENELLRAENARLKAELNR